MEGSSAPRVDLVLPVYNEERVLAESVRRLLARTADWPANDWRVVVVDNASIDATPRIGARLAADDGRVVFERLARKGRGHALLHAWGRTDAAVSLYMDVDLSTDLDAVPVVLARLADGADLVTGSRLHRASVVTRSLKREVLSRGYNLLVRLLFGRQPFDDAQCGFKGIRTATVRPLLPLVRNDHWFFDTELLLLASYAGLRVEAIPVRWIDDPDTRVNIPQTVLEDLRGLARLRRTIRPVVRAWSAERT